VGGLVGERSLNGTGRFRALRGTGSGRSRRRRWQFVRLAAAAAAAAVGRRMAGRLEDKLGDAPADLVVDLPVFVLTQGTAVTRDLAAAARLVGSTVAVPAHLRPSPCHPLVPHHPQKKILKGKLRAYLGNQEAEGGNVRR